MEQQIGETIKNAQDSRAQVKRHIKQIALALVATGVLVLEWWLLRETMFGGRHPSFWAWPIVVPTLWITLISFYALVNPDRIQFFIFNALGLAAYLVIMPRDLYIFAGGILFFLMSMWFQRRVQGEEKGQLNFSIRRTLGNSQVIITYAFLILAASLIYTNVSDNFSDDPKAFYRQMANAAVRGVPYFSENRSLFNLNQSMGEFFRKQAQDQFPQFNSVTAAQQRELLSEVREGFLRQFGVDANENATLRVVLAEVITERLSEALGQYERFFPLIFTAVVFALLRMFSFIFNWATVAVSWLLYKILLGLRFFKIKKEMVEVEKLDI